MEKEFCKCPTCGLYSLVRNPKNEEGKRGSNSNSNEQRKSKEGSFGSIRREKPKEVKRRSIIEESTKEDEKESLSYLNSWLKNVKIGDLKRIELKEGDLCFFCGFIGCQCKDTDREFIGFRQNLPSPEVIRQSGNEKPDKPSFSFNKSELYNEFSFSTKMHNEPEKPEKPENIISEDTFYTAKSQHSSLCLQESKIVSLLKPQWEEFSLANAIEDKKYFQRQCRREPMTKKCEESRNNISSYSDSELSIRSQANDSDHDVKNKLNMEKGSNSSMERTPSQRILCWKSAEIVSQNKR